MTKIPRPRKEYIQQSRQKRKDDLEFLRLMDQINDELEVEEYDFELYYWTFEAVGSHKLMDNAKLREAEGSVNIYKEEEFDG